MKVCPYCLCALERGGHVELPREPVWVLPHATCEWCHGADQHVYQCDNISLDALNAKLFGPGSWTP